MPRIELWMTVFAGLAGGLAGVLWAGLVTPLVRGGTTANSASHAETAAVLLAGVVRRATAGAALGFLFWLGWGLIAIVGQPWFVVGPLFGALAWVAVAMPALGTLLLHAAGVGATIALRARPLVLRVAAAPMALAGLALLVNRLQ